MRNQKELRRRSLSVTIETERVLLVRRTDIASEGRCEQCGARVTIMTMNAAEAISLVPSPGSESAEAGIPPAHHPVGSS